MNDDNSQLSGVNKIFPPKSQAELLTRCQVLVGKTLGQVAAEQNIFVPENLQRHKGWVGNLLEIALGANAGNKAQPDFVDLAIEMKTLPLNAQGQPKESTYVCTVSMKQSGELCWQDSWVKHKLAHVLWVPVEADVTIPLAERYIGQAWLWKPSLEQDAILQRDWEDLMDRIVLGEQAEITAKEGDYLQIRPKAANGKVLSTGVSESGLHEKINPKGFYLRTSFTKQLLEQG
ncbi:MAG: DNA mismatch repair endonuclease MutH [Gammaproteobacteria bacterium]|nr:MAG: DNA mismatch repair endonuclease MutH [Gammaproteobacteria bacterium]RKZ97200.1 MAG: DNA mismatch repair endonuclease MutH [Gammaproteobacteria bacterium]